MQALEVTVSISGSTLNQAGTTAGPGLSWHKAYQQQLRAGANVTDTALYTGHSCFQLPDSIAYGKSSDYGTASSSTHRYLARCIEGID